MRIVHLTRDFPPAPSGIGDHVARAAAEMAARGDDVVVVCSPPAHPAGDVDVRAVVDRWDGAGVEKLVAAVADARPDAILWHYNPFQIGRRGVAPFAGTLAKKLADVAPLVTVLHELWYPWGRSGARGVVWAAAQRTQIRGVVAASSKILLTTERRRADLARRHPSRAADIGVVAAGGTVDAVGKPDRARWNLPEDAFVLAHLGAIGEGRDFAPALHAIESLRGDGRDVRLLLAGRIGVAAPARDYVHATGALSHEDLSSALASADAYLYVEPIGPVSRKTSLLSALAHGLPVVAYDGPDAEPQFRDGENVSLVEPSAGAIASAIGRLHDDDAHRERLAAGAKRLSDERYAWHVIAETMRAAAAAARSTRAGAES